MTNLEIVSMLSRILNDNFWDFRCYFVHPYSSITVDLKFFKLAKNSEIVFGSKGDITVGLYTFENKDLNKLLKCSTIEEYQYKELVLRFFFLRKKLIRIKRGENFCEDDLWFFVRELFATGRCYGEIEMLEALKRHSEYNQSNERGIKTLNVFSLPIGGKLDGIFSIARRFRPNKKNSRQDALGRKLETIVSEYVAKNRKYPDYMKVIHALEKMAAAKDDTIQEVDKEVEEIYWRRSKGNEAEPTSFKQLRERLTLIRKKIRFSR